MHGGDPQRVRRQPGQPQRLASGEIPEVGRTEVEHSAGRDPMNLRCQVSRPTCFRERGSVHGCRCLNQQAGQQCRQLAVATRPVETKAVRHGAAQLGQIRHIDIV
jgi:hypothetical protein